ncbi:MAG: hypothetical protein ACD_20C00287G0007 [uncultured bacterium]|nr:MAG: hypothetical protein ACD_20C00287G0007 [uncultured bacterium]HBH18265.1 type II secretion system protein GspE [Cyanobacteria bacterium UBA9579]
MSSFIPENLKDSINKEYVNKFSIDTLKQEMFIPVNKQDDVLYVGIVDAENRERRNSILTKVIMTTKLKPKVIALTQQQFDELIETCESESFNSTSESVSNLVTQVNEAVQSDHFNQLSQKDQPEQLIDKSQQDQPIKLNEPVISVKPVSSSLAPKKKLGEQLIDEGLITEEQLSQALAESKQTGTPIGSALVKLGFIHIDQLREALSIQQGYAHVESKDLKVEPNVIRLLPEDFIRENRAVPISTDGKTIMVGMVNPNDKQVLNDIIYLTGLKPFPLILTHIEYERCIVNFFETKRETEKLMEEISLDEDILIIEENLWQQVEKEFEDESNLVARFASSLIIEAIEKKASDIHIEPRSDKYIVRYRTDGILRQILEVPAKIENLLISRLKVVARMDIAEHRRPQDGSFTLKYNNNLYNLRLNTLPVGAKEKMVIRILRSDLRIVNKESKKIELVGASREDVKRIELMTTSPHGIILATGPTGSGKTTTLYSILNKVNNEMVNITTVEDPVEIKLEGINQIQVNAKADITFASCMRAILRQDPDIIMVGEIRDIETLDAAIYASLTGHLVLSSVHTNSATATITRLINMGAAPYLIASSLVGVIAQRLMRKLCPMCRELYVPSEQELELIVSNPDDYDGFSEHKIYKAVGCSNCDNTGYIGRMGVYEVMPINRELKKIITNSNIAHEIEEIAVSCGMRTLQRSGLDAILKGDTTINEYIRTLGANND